MITVQTQIKNMRDSGETIQSIADYFGKSIYWVYGQINKKYGAKFRPGNITVREENIPSPLTEIQKLRSSGLTYQEISKITGKSLTTVYKNCRGIQERASKESVFVNTAVIPYLTALGHTDIIQQYRINSQRVDLYSLSKYNIPCLTEAKVTDAGHSIQTAIGQLIQHKFYLPQAILQLAIPITISGILNITQDFTDYLEQFDIYVLVIPYENEVAEFSKTKNSED